MDAYLYESALYCGPCIVERLIRQGKASPAGRDMRPALVLEQIVAANGFLSESDYDSGDLPKGPFSNGGGEADCPQHCDDCGEFLENPLTGDGEKYIREAIAGEPNETTALWAAYYGVDDETS